MVLKFKTVWKQFYEFVFTNVYVTCCVLPHTFAVLHIFINMYLNSSIVCVRSH